ncbi:MAG: molybdate ABC transporter substrate-binding protein [Pseudomonadota bacterium]
MRFLVFLMCLLLALPVQAGNVRVAVASNFAPAMEALARAFELQQGHPVEVMAGSSGSIYAQIRQGAPFDLFLSADAARPARLVEDGLARPQHRAPYAFGSLVFWTMKNRAALETPGDVSAYLATLRPRSVAIANPATAPYGQAAMQVLAALGQAKVSPVQGQNVGQAFTLVASGNASAGFVARSQFYKTFQTAIDNIPPGSMWLVPADLHAPIQQDMVLLLRARQNSAAQALFAWLQGPYARTRIEAWGYTLPGKP